MKAKFTAIIISYLRPQNIQRICDNILELKEVNNLIVSNNNPSVELRNYFKSDDDRVKLINQVESSGAVKRFEIAHEIGSSLFFSIDDDLFLNKEQIKYLQNQLLKNPSAPHGFWGQNYLQSENESTFEYGIINKDGKVDILNRAYFFTLSHVQEFFNLIHETETPLSEVGPCDDIFLSFSGEERPFIHDIKAYTDCPTSNTYGIAQWKDEKFDTKRTEIIKRLLKVKKFNF